MSLYGKSKSGKVTYFNTHAAIWQAVATSIGTTTTACTALEALVSTAQEKLDAQAAAEQAAKLATSTANDAIAQMVAAGADIIKNIRAKAANSPNPQTVYDMAQVDPPAPPTPVTDLGTPTDFKVELGQTGAVTTSWKCSNPRASGTIYQVWRKLEGEANFTYLGGTGEKKFTDETIPAGSATTTYKIQAARSTAKGPWAVCQVMFGVSDAGAATAKVVKAGLAA